MKNSKVFLLGLDGACFESIDPLLEKGKLPTFKKLLDGGARANLRSTVPPTTIPSWISIFTGLNQGKLGCFGQMRWEESSYRMAPVSILSWRGKLLWDIVGEKEKVGVFRVPTLSRSYPINGFMITDIYSWSGTSRGNVYPRGLMKEIERFWITQSSDGIFNIAKIKRALINFKRRVEAAIYLLEHKEMRLFVFLTLIPDIISHMTADLSKIDLAYMTIDRELSRLVRKAEKLGYNIIMISDHGIGRRINKRFSVNQWLLENGFLTLRKESSFRSRVENRLVEGLKGKGFSPFLRSLRASFQQKTGKDLYSDSQWEEIIRWEKTKAFSYGGEGTNYIGVQINLQGLFPHGTVKPVEYEDLRNKIHSRLKEYIDPQTGLSVVDEILMKEQMFYGENTALLPDIILKTKENYRATPFFTSSILSPDEDLVHTENGVFVAYGPLFRKGLRMDDASVVDIVPTVLHILGIPIPKDVDGKVVKQAFRKDSGLTEKKTIYQEPKKIKEAPPVDEKEKEGLTDRLRALGYLE